MCCPRSRYDSPFAVVEFLLGALDHRGRTVETYLSADDEWLEDRHDWV